ncbi:MAG: hypothetical protein A2W25_14925 [candidate division Zixibacteria bacterium RBG_16_53_22]|nr:MAG: hypothetical protein A2W25_14925 [candidate division Zixibacteria bacterium RBG_16_53_22]
MWIGLFLVLAGALILLNNMEILRGDVWDYIWPLFFIMLGASMIIKRLRIGDRQNFYPGETENKSPGGGPDR